MTRRTRMTFARAAAAAVAVASVVTVAPGASAAPVGPGLLPPVTPVVGTQWRLVSTGYARTAPKAYKDAHASFTLSSKGVGGNDGCNGFGGDAEVRGHSVTFGPLISTMMACIRPGAGAIFHEAFKGTRTFTVVGNRLHLQDGPRGYWNFVAEKPVDR
ncbi:META domain-containing protein [Tsukamurella sp. 8F]|uniref:META domain-containing protein n=1 Tax=unclassified Tsukamurella TaxID=2633480 RepID=UPI0023B88B6A|nr:MULTISPECIES: META domain-containing protein [unclassified Tsukamurella]MDF0528484.1 META domain-containing protein [Tsukamurella sp. 8J]MDF0586310.1 META domain-containing protein [Tsukamurella sp. 8F]